MGEKEGLLCLGKPCWIQLAFNSSFPLILPNPQARGQDNEENKFWIERLIISGQGNAVLGGLSLSSRAKTQIQDTHTHKEIQDSMTLDTMIL